MEPLGSILIAAGALTEEQLQDGLRAQQQHRGRLGTNLVERDYLDLDRLSWALAKQRGVPLLGPKELESASDRALVLMPKRVAQAHLAVPLALENRALVVAMANAWDPQAVDALERELRSRVVARLAPELLVMRYLERYYDLEIDRPVPVRRHLTREELRAAIARGEVDASRLGRLAPDESLAAEADGVVVRTPSEVAEGGRECQGEASGAHRVEVGVARRAGPRGAPADPRCARGGAGDPGASAGVVLVASPGGGAACTCAAWIAGGACPGSACVCGARPDPQADHAGVRPGQCSGLSARAAASATGATRQAGHAGVRSAGRRSCATTSSASSCPGH
jgi:hypothetical protein